MNVFDLDYGVCATRYGRTRINGMGLFADSQILGMGICRSIGQICEDRHAVHGSSMIMGARHFGEGWFGRYSMQRFCHWNGLNPIPAESMDERLQLR